MKKSLLVNQYRLKMCRNFLYDNIKKTPMLMSLLIVIPFSIYVISELMISADISIYAINPDLLALFNSFPAFFHRLLYHSLIIAAPIYIFISQLNIKTYMRYKNMNISFKQITISNISLFVFIVNFFLIVSILFILSKTASAALPCLIFIAMFSYAISIIIIVLFLSCQILVNLIRQIIKKGNTLFFEFVIVELATSLFLYPIAHLPISLFMSIPSFVNILLLLLSVIFIIILYKKTKINNSYILHRTFFNKERILCSKRNISELTNYFLMLFHMKSVFLEYMLTFFFFILLLIFANKLSIIESLFLQIMLPVFLISNGLIFSFKSWYDLRSKQIFTHILTYDFLLMSIVLLIIVSCCFTYVYGTILIHQLIIAISTYLILVLIQGKIKLAFRNDNKSPIIFILVYGSIAYFITACLEWSFTYVSGF